MNYFKFKNALIGRIILEDGSKYTVTVDGKDVTAGSIQGLVKVLNEIYRIPKAEILDEIWGDYFKQYDIYTSSYSAKIKAAIEFDKEGLYSLYKGLTFEALEDSTLTISHYGTNATTTKPNFQYSTDGETWTDWDDTPIAFAKGTQLYIRGNNPTGVGSGSQNASMIQGTGAYRIFGDIRSVLSYDFEEFVFGDIDWALYYLFGAPTERENTAIKDAYHLLFNFDVVGGNSLNYMFDNCTELKRAPKSLYAKTIYYEGLKGYCNNCRSLEVGTNIVCNKAAVGAMYKAYENCTSLVSAPYIKCGIANKEAMEYMFSGCTNLKHANNIYIKKAGEQALREMFLDCTSLVSAPIGMPEEFTVNTQFACYLTFKGCTSLKVAPKLPATKLEHGCYSGMFENCTSLTDVQEVLPALEIAPYAYQMMFARCTSLVRMPRIYATKVNAYGCYNMFRECISLKDTQYELPALELDEFCYAYMFYGSGIVHGVRLPATEMKNRCYAYMYQTAPYLEDVYLNIKEYVNTYAETRFAINWVSLSTSLEAPIEKRVIYDMYPSVDVSELIKDGQIIATFNQRYRYWSKRYTRAAIV